MPSRHFNIFCFPLTDRLSVFLERERNIFDSLPATIMVEVFPKITSFIHISQMREISSARLACFYSVKRWKELPANVVPANLP